MSFSTPILLIVFNRPETTRRVLGAIRQAAPERLFVAADGPRPGRTGEAEKCAEVLKLVEDGVDWPCELSYLRRETNLGCGRSPSSAIEWLFAQVEEGIILEDDCLPSPAFFPFCASVLERYRNETRIGHIGGFNCQFGRRRGPASYYFSRFFHVWGWATWKRAWQGFDMAMSDYPQFLAEGMLDKLFERRALREFWKRNFDDIAGGRTDVWDYQWVYRNLKDDRLAVVPNHNMIENIGFGEDATHTVTAKKAMPEASPDVSKDFIHPRFLVPDPEADDFTYRNHVGLDWFYDLKRPARLAARALGLRR